MNDLHIESRCHTCPFRARAERKPRSLAARFWRWHTGWCPGWTGYTKELKSKGIAVPKV